MIIWTNGEYYTEKGLRVYYDLEWFQKDGHGIDGISIRNYELQEFWPHLKVNVMPNWINAFYKHFLAWPQVSCLLPEIQDINRSIYFRGYNSIPIEDSVRIMHSYLRVDTASLTRRMFLEPSKRYCGVHVRRGDLADLSIPLYSQVADGYFIRDIEFVSQHESIDEFLLFSDDVQWIKDNITPKVKFKCRVMEGNKGYEDLILLAQCQIIIASQGSFGTMAAIINSNCELLISNFENINPLYAKRVMCIQ